LLRKFDAIVLAGGSTIPRDLSIEGRQLNGVSFAMDFLKQQNKRVSFKEAINNLTAEGKHVVVIGGGDTGSDCVGTSNRQGALSVTQLELLPQPPASRTANMPWPIFPMVHKTTSSHEEGADRKWAITTKEFIADESGNLQALKIVDLEWKLLGDGRPAQFVEIAGSERTIPCQLALLAMGFLHPQHEGLINGMGIELDERGNVKATDKNYQTNIQKIFAAGDVRRGQSLVVWAINEGRECAENVHDYLIGSKSLV
jgi:glutamate synthase (NADPH/NADH) small chain